MEEEKHQNPYNTEEQDFEDIEEDPQSIKYLNNASECLEWAQKDKKIKVILETSPIQQNIELFDISLYKGGPLEDKKYSGRKNYRINIRRGNSICKLQQDQQCFFIRRGMQKFYDLQYEYLHPNQKINLYHQRVKNIIFDPIKTYLNQPQTLEKTHQFSVKIYKLFKENGEHCQISYTNKIAQGTWLIASKNVTILARDRSDINLYKKERFYWAKLIAEEWFNILEKIGSENLQNLKKEMEQKTFIGEYCGYEKKQHITTYDKIQIIFYAIVKNNSEDICLPVENAIKIFKRYNLNIVDHEQTEKILDFQTFNTELTKIMHNTAIGTMEKEGEGGVVYVVGQQTDQQNPDIVLDSTTLSLCKLKTTEYRIHRKLRELLKTNFQKEKGNKNARFQFEVEQESKFYLPPKPLRYYLELARLAFEKVDSEKQDWETLRYEYVNFIENIRLKNEDYLTQFLSKKNEESQLILSNKQQEETQEKSLYIFVTPPAYLSDTNINQLIKYLDIEHIDTIYREPKEGEKKLEKNTLIIAHMVPKITEKSKNKNIFIILLGITQQDFDFTQKYFENNKEQIQKSRYSSTNQTVFQYLQSKNLQQSLDLLQKKMTAFQEFLEQNQFQDQTIIFEDTHQVLTENMILTILKKSKNIDQIPILEKKLSSKNNSQETSQNQSQNLSINSENLDQKKQSSLKDENIVLLVVSVFALPGAGKSHISQHFKQMVEQKETPFTHFVELSSDKIRESLMKSLKKKHPKLDKQQLFELTKQQISQKFTQNLEIIIQNVSKSIQNTQKQKKILLFIDRNNVPSKAYKIPNLVQEFTQKTDNLSSENVKHLALVPEIAQQLQMGKKKYPFSLDFLLHCIERLLNKRRGHETMEDDDLEAVKIPMKFFLDYKNYSFSSLQQKQQQQKDVGFEYLYSYQFGIDSFENLNFQGKKEQKRLENWKQQAINLQRLLGQSLKSGQKPQNNQDYQFDDQKVSSFIQEFYTKGFEIDENLIKSQFQIQKLTKFLNQHF